MLCKQGFKLKDLDKQLVTRQKRYFTNQSQKKGLDKTQFGLHDLRSREATTAANFGINCRLFQQHGRRKSKIHENTRTMLSVSKNLDL